MNIIPVNFHALMRDIPLANLYNYEYTFEQMVASLYGEQSSKYTQTGGLPDNETKTSRQMLLRLLNDPYSQVSLPMYGSEVYNLGTSGFIHRIFRGDNNLGMGRPKFLSDQLFNKSLFGSIYQSQSDYDEAGPGVGVGISRGIGNQTNLLRYAFNTVQELAKQGNVIYTALVAPVDPVKVPNNTAAVNAALAILRKDPMTRAVAAAAVGDRDALQKELDKRITDNTSNMMKLINAFKQLSAILPGPAVVTAGVRTKLDAIDAQVTALETALAAFAPGLGTTTAARVAAAGP